MMKIKISLLLVAALLSFQVQAKIVGKEISYRQGDTEMKGYVAYDDSIRGKRPGVLVVHEWWGHNAYSRQRADMLAKLGYTALAVDMYGDGKQADHPSDAGKFAKAVASNMPVAKARFEAALQTLKSQPTVDARQIAAIGYCFGGGVVLNMARQGVDLQGVASFHGSLGTSQPAQKGDVKAAIRVFTGAEDPMVNAEQVAAFEKEMSAAGVDYELVSYPGAKHAFTNPDATALGQKFNLPLAYDANADADSWRKMQAFFKQLFK